MKILYFIVFLLIGRFSYSEEFSPYIHISNAVEGQNRQYSGVVYAEDPSFYYVLTCWHGTIELKDHQINLHSNVLTTSNSPIVYLALKSEIIKEDEDKDLAVLKFQKIEMVSIPVVFIQDSTIPIGERAIGYGYANSFNVIKNPVIIKSYDKYTSSGGSLILECEGAPISGMSGGPLIYNNKIYGIQSAGNDKVLYCPSSEIFKFLGK